jgi:tetratricopeptide (TPR) repeat protein
MRLRVVSLALVLALASCSSEATKQKYLTNADKLFSNGKYVEAAASYEKALSIDPRFARAYYGRGRCLLRLKNFNDAGGDFRRAAQLLPPNSAERKELDVQLAYALVHSWNGQDQAEVERVGVDLCRRDPKSFDGRRLLGDLALFRARQGVGGPKWCDFLVDDAVNEYRIAAEVHPNDASVELQLARCLALKGSPTESERAYRATMQLDKREPDAYAELYRLLLAQGKLSEAEQVLRDAISSVPSHQGFALMLAAQALVTDPATSLPVIEQLKSREMGLPSPNLIAGDFYVRAGQLDRAKQEFRRGVPAKQSELACRVRLLRIATFENNDNDLKELVPGTLKIDANNAVARTAGAVLKLRAGDTETAERELLSLQDTVIDGPLARYHLARIQAGQAQFVDARQTLEVALQRQPDFVQARLLLAQVQLILKDNTEARKSAEQVLAIRSDNAQARSIVESAKAAGNDSSGPAESYILKAEANLMNSDGSAFWSEANVRNTSTLQPIELKNSVCDAAVVAFNKMRAKNYERFDLVAAVPGVWSTEAFTPSTGN